MCWYSICFFVKTSLTSRLILWYCFACFHQRDNLGHFSANGVLRPTAEALFDSFGLQASVRCAEACVRIFRRCLTPHMDVHISQVKRRFLATSLQLDYNSSTATVTLAVFSTSYTKCRPQTCAHVAHHATLLRRTCRFGAAMCSAVSF